MGRVFSTTGISLINSGGGTVTDSTGLVSTTSFDTDGESPAYDTAVTSGTYVTLGTIKACLSNVRAVNCLLIFSSLGTVTDGQLLTVRYVDPVNRTYYTYHTSPQSVSSNQIYADGLSVGTHSYIVSAKVSGGTAYLEEASVIAAGLGN